VTGHAGARIEGTTWGPYRALRLADEAVALVVAPDLGGRVVSIVDRRSGREWLVQGRPPDAAEAAAWAAEDVVFDGRTSFGWDECLPTVAPSPDPVVAGAPVLRDHGDQWGRRAESRADGAGGSLAVTFASPRWAYAFERRLSLVGDATVLAEYRLSSRADVPLPVLWSMHPVLALEPGTRVDLGGADRARLTWANGLPLSPSERIDWPLARRDDGERIDLSLVRGPEGWAAKLYAAAPEVVRAVAPDGSALELRWDRATAPAAGVWVSTGGWPVGGPPAEQVALEPTSSPDDDLGDAMAHGRAMAVEPGGERRWWVRVTLVPSG
jgi:galactose mutarotase-like enzyme